MKYTSFINDEEKMRDFIQLNRDDFLASYSYLTDEEYDKTCLALIEKIRKNFIDG